MGDILFHPPRSVRSFAQERSQESLDTLYQKRVLCTVSALGEDIRAFKKDVARSEYKTERYTEHAPSKVLISDSF